MTTNTDTYVRGGALLLLVGLLVALGIYWQRPPALVAAGAPPTAFSAERALEHLKVVASRPHPLNSPQCAEVREYLLRQLAELGVSAEVQQTVAVNGHWAPPYPAATVHNVVGTLKGTGGKKAVLLVSHYDTVPNSPGASDDGSGVVALLETARALKAAPPLKNDVIFLFTEGEEAGLLGAKAFVDEHPLAKEVGLVLNFEARGNSGPSIMFETSNGNSDLIRGFAAASPFPFGNSLSYEIYRLLPNETDFTIFKRAGYPGLNFAYIKGVTHYHTSIDNLEELDPRSLQHQGDYALALAQHFGNAELGAAGAGNAVYFNFLGSHLSTYSVVWVLPLALLALLLFAAAVFLGFRKGHLKFSGILLGFLGVLLSLLVAAVATGVAFFIISKVQGVNKLFAQGESYNSHLYMWGFLAFTLLVVAASYVLLRRWADTPSAWVGALLWWLLLAVVTGLFLPGGAYLFTWPLLFSLCGMLFWFYRTGPAGGPSKSSVVPVLCAVPGVVLFSQMIYLLSIGLGFAFSTLIVIMAVLLLGLLFPLLEMLFMPKKLLALGLVTAACLLFFVLGAVDQGFNNRHPRPDNVLYALDADEGKAAWISLDSSPDEWTSQFFAAKAHRKNMAKFFPFFPTSWLPFLNTDAPAAALPAPEVRLLEERKTEAGRSLKLSVSSPRGAPVVLVYLAPETEVRSASVNGKPVDFSSAAASKGRSSLVGKQPWGVQYWLPPNETLELTVEVGAAQPIKVTAVDKSLGLPEVGGNAVKARLSGLMQAPAPFNDAAMVSKSFTF